MISPELLYLLKFILEYILFYLKGGYLFQCEKRKFLVWSFSELVWYNHACQWFFAAEKGIVFTKYWCFRELIKRYSSTFFIRISPTMNTDALDFWRLVGFWDGRCGLSVSLSGDRFSLLTTWLNSFMFEDATSVLVKCVLCSFIWMYLNNTIPLYIFHSAFLLC